MAGLVILFVAPSASRILLVDGRLVRLLLGPTDAQRLRASRAAAVDDSAIRLRRIERDLHDGAQAQLAALAMKLGMAKEELGAGEVDAAAALVDAAHAGAKDALAELRNLARGIHPPILEAGLVPALETLAARSAVPVGLWYTLDRRPSATVETIAYFSAAELLANVAKHSRADRAMVFVEPLGTDRLRLLVCDDGVGGVRPDRGGLAGLAERVATVDGRLTVTSPPGGPTVVTVELPVRA
jgi:signal transduction histidine kinase